MARKKKAKKKRARARAGAMLSRHGKPMGHIPTQLPNFPPVYRGRVIKSRARPSLRQTQQLMGGPTIQNMGNPQFFGNSGVLTNAAMAAVNNRTYAIERDTNQKLAQLRGLHERQIRRGDANDQHIAQLTQDVQRNLVEVRGAQGQIQRVANLHDARDQHNAAMLHAGQTRADAAENASAAREQIQRQHIARVAAQNTRIMQDVQGLRQLSDARSEGITMDRDRNEEQFTDISDKIERVDIDLQTEKLSRRQQRASEHKSTLLRQHRSTRAASGQSPAWKSDVEQATAELKEVVQGVRERLPGVSRATDVTVVGTPVTPPVDDLAYGAGSAPAKVDFSGLAQGLTGSARGTI